MNDILKWFDANKAWVFEGIGVTVLSAIGSVIILWLRRRRDKENENKNKGQVQISGDNSINIQSGRDISIGNRTGGLNDKQANSEKR